MKGKAHTMSNNLNATKTAPKQTRDRQIQEPTAGCKMFTYTTRKATQGKPVPGKHGNVESSCFAVEHTFKHHFVGTQKQKAIKQIAISSTNIGAQLLCIIGRNGIVRAGHRTNQMLKTNSSAFWIRSHGRRLFGCRRFFSEKKRERETLARILQRETVRYDLRKRGV